MTARILKLHTHWRLTFKSPGPSAAERNTDEVWVDAWLANQPVSLYAAVHAAIRDEPALRQSSMTAAIRVRLREEVVEAAGP
ncbi:MAG: hypothetical protein RIC56_07595 [Pseudomonadales bacterium]